MTERITTEQNIGLHDLLLATEAFHNAAGLPNPGAGEAAELTKDDGLRALRIWLLREEYQEYIDGEDTDNLVEVVDGLLDIIVVAWGSLIAYVGTERARLAAHEVARSNLQKILPDGSVIRRADGKILKPAGWEPPNIPGVLGLT